MPNTFDCPNCGAPLDYASGADPTIRCPFCGSSVIVPEELRTTSAPAQTGFSLGSLASQATRLKALGDLVRSDKKDEAVRLYQQTFGGGLKDAQEAVDNLAAGRPVRVAGGTSITTFSTGDLKFEWSGFADQVGALSAEQQAAAMKQIVQLVRAGNQIEAIKLYRESFGTSLQAAKEQVDRLSAAITGARPQRARAGSALGVLFSLIAGLGILVGAAVAFYSLLPAQTQTAVSDAVGQVVASVPAVRGYASVAFRFGSEGIGPGMFKDARGIAVDNNGHLFVSEYGGGRVQVFDMDGKFITQWTVQGQNKDVYLTGLAADRKGIVYAVHDSELFRYDGLSGELLGQVAYDEGWGFDDVVTTADGGFVAAWYKNRDDIVRFNNDGQVETKIEAAISTASGDSELDTKVAADGLGNIYALGTFNCAVFKFAPDGRYLSRFGSEGDEPGQFRAPYAIAVDGQGRVYVSDFKGIQVFDGDGRYLDVIEADSFIYGLTFTDRNELFAAAGTQVIKYVLNEP